MDEHFLLVREEERRRPVWPLIKTETTKLTKNLHFNTKMRQNATQRFFQALLQGVKQREANNFISRKQLTKSAFFRD